MQAGVCAARTCIDAASGTRRRRGRRGERAGGPCCRNSRRGETAPVAIPQVAQLLAVGLAYEHVEGCGAAGSCQGGDCGGRGGHFLAIGQDDRALRGNGHDVDVAEVAAPPNEGVTGGDDAGRDDVGQAHLAAAGSRALVDGGLKVGAGQER